jgi:hypothetical protein
VGVVFVHTKALTKVGFLAKGTWVSGLHETMKKGVDVPMKAFAYLTVGVLLFSGCASATPTQKGAVAGSAIGAGLGAIIGHQSGETAKGALIGAAAGGLGGALLGDVMATKFCPTCGRDYLATDPDRCPFDGTTLRAKGAPAQTVQEQQAQSGLPNFCPTCGTSYAQGTKFCPKCGTELKAKQ